MIYEILIALIIVCKESIETIKFFYKEFDFPLLFLVFIIIFYPSISELIKNIKSMNINLSDKSFELEIDVKKAVIDMSKFTQSLIDKYGKEIVYEGQRGGGASNQTEEYSHGDYFNLITSSLIFNQQIEKFSTYEIVEKLFYGYECLLTSLTGEENFKGLFIDKHLDDLIEADDLINKFYHLCVDMKNEGKKISVSQANKYRRLIFATYSTTEKVIETKNNNG